MGTQATQPILEVEGLRVRVGGREVLRGIDLVVGEGETHVLLGPNGCGKTTLLNTIIGFPGYQVTAGSIRFKGTDLLPLTIDERTRMGIGIAYQRPPAVRGVSLRRVMEVSAGGTLTTEAMDDISERLDVAELLDRDVNAGFSGGEAKRSEMAQLLAQGPELALFDEPESGVDLENVAVVGGAIQHLLTGGPDAHARAGLLITHTGHILSYVSADVGHVLFDGRLVCQGNPLDLIADIRDGGFEKCAGCASCRQ